MAGDVVQRIEKPPQSVWPSRTAGWIAGRFRESNFPWRALGPLVALAVLIAIVGATLADSRSDELWFEVSKAAIQFVAIAVLGGAATAAFRSLEHRREDRLRLDEFRARTADELWDAYHGVKTVRRSLLAAGFRPDRSGPVTAEQMTRFWTLMETLNEEQLTLERLQLTVKTQRHLFEPSGDQIASLLRQAEKYVNGVLDAWREDGDAVNKGEKDFADLMREAPDFAAFVGPSKAGKDEPKPVPLGIKPGLSEPVEKAAGCIQALRLSGIDAAL